MWFLPRVSQAEQTQHDKAAIYLPEKWLSEATTALWLSFKATFDKDLIWMLNITIIKQSAISANLFIIAASLLHCGSIMAPEDTLLL